MADLPTVRKVDPLRIPPHSIDAEQAVLGGLMLKPEALNEIADWLTDGDFYRRDHAITFRAISELASAGREPDAVTMGEWFEAAGLADIVSARYLLELANTTPSARSIVAYAEIVLEKSNARKLIDIGTELVGEAFDAKGSSTRDIAAKAAAEILELAGAQRIRGARNMRDIGVEFWSKFSDRMESKTIPGIATPFGKLNKMTGGLQPADYWIVGARPSMGKTTFMTNIAAPPAMNGHRVLIFSLEQSALQLYTRMACALARVEMRFVREPDAFDSDTIAKVSAAVAMLRSSALIIDDTPGLTRQQMVIRAKREHMRAPLAMILVDNLQRAAVPGKTRLDIEQGDISRDLKDLGKSLNVAVMLLAQLNRSLEQRQNKRPILADLREAGGLEQDGDVIVMLYRDDYYAEAEGRQSEYPGTIEINVAKGRDVGTGTIFAEWHGAINLIEHMDHVPQRILPEKPAKPDKGFGGKSKKRDVAESD